jgi:hypothetical protein
VGDEVYIAVEVSSIPHVVHRVTSFPSARCMGAAIP